MHRKGMSARSTGDKIEKCKPPAPPRSLIEEIAESIMSPDFSVSTAMLQRAICEGNIGVLRLLLLHPSSRPEVVLPKVIEWQAQTPVKSSAITALLECSHIQFLPKNDPVMLSACKYDNETVVRALLNHLSFPREEILGYASDAVVNGAHHVLKCLLPYCQDVILLLSLALQSSHTSKEQIILALISSLTCSGRKRVELPETVLVLASSATPETIQAVFGACSNRIIPSTAIQCAKKDSRAFRALVGSIQPEALQKLYYGHCALGREEDIPYIIDVFGTKRLPLTAQVLSANIISENLFHLLTTQPGLCVCDKEVCVPTLLFSKKRVNKLLAVLRGMRESRGSTSLVPSLTCSHIEGLLCTALNLSDLPEREELLDCLIALLGDSVELDTVLSILTKSSPEIMGKFLDRMERIDETVVLHCLWLERSDLVALLCTRYTFDLGWNNYRLVREAAGQYPITSGLEALLDEQRPKITY